MRGEHENIIRGIVKVGRVLYPKKGVVPTNDFKIISVTPEDIETGIIELTSYDNFVIKGNAPDIKQGETYHIVLKEDEPNNYGKQYNIMYIGNPVDCNDKESQKIFLQKVLGDKKVDELYKVLDDPFKSIVDEDIDSLTKCKGIGVKTARKLIKKYKDNINYSKAYVELDKYGLTQLMIEKLVDRYMSPDIAIEKINSNPYILADEVSGIGFKKADEIALRGGVEKTSKFRIQSFLKSRLKEGAENGHSYMHPSELFKSLVEVLEVELDEVKDNLVDSLSTLKENESIWYNDDRSMISLNSTYKLENNIGVELIRLLNAKCDKEFDKWEKVIERTEENQRWEFTNEQKDGIKKVLDNQVNVITGGAGVGKSSVVAGVLDVLHKEYDLSFAQAALSGKAGARLAETTGEEGHTIHRLLEFNPAINGFGRNGDDPLEQDVIIVDEFSMIGAELFYDLLRAIKDGAKLILLGDVAQLEAIGIGNIAKDIIDSGVIPVSNLTKIHRQAAKSAIVTDSIKVKNGEQITGKDYAGVSVRGELEDLVLDIYDDKDYTHDRVIDYFKQEYSKNPNIMDIQVIVPMRFNGKASVFEINNRIQNIYNPYREGKKSVKINVSKDKSYDLREGDKIINTKNNYKTMNLEGVETFVFNGDIGVITEIDEEFGDMTVEFERVGDVVIERGNWKDLVLSYAITIHSSQGSESKTVIIGLDYSSYILLSREIVYTAITRASEKCIVCAENQALRHAIGTSKVSEKRTFLKDILREGVK